MMVLKFKIQNSKSKRTSGFLNFFRKDKIFYIIIYANGNKNSYSPLGIIQKRNPQTRDCPICGFFIS